MKFPKTLVIFCIILILSLIFIRNEVFSQATCGGCYSQGECCCNPGSTEFCCGGCNYVCPNFGPSSVQDCCDATGCWTQCCGGGCFTGETEISVGQEGERAGEQERETKEIKDLQPGDIVSSFNPETGEVVEGTVSDVTKTTREGYYILETEGGYKVKVTGEHPFLAIKSEKNQESINQVSNFKEQLKDILSNTLTYKLITGLQAKIAGILP